MSSYPSDPRELDDLVDDLVEELRRRWRHGDRAAAEELLDRHAELWQQPAVAAELVCEEVALRTEAGEADASTAVLGRFPQWSGQLRVLLDCYTAIEGSRPEPEFPGVGDVIDAFRLVA